MRAARDGVQCPASARQVLIDAASAACAAAADGFLPAFLVRAHGSARGGPVRKVPGDRREDQGLAADARVGEAGAEFLVLRAPARKVLVEAVRLQQVRAPERLVARLDGDERIGSPTELCREPRRVQRIGATPEVDACRPRRRNVACCAGAAASRPRRVECARPVSSNPVLQPARGLPRTADATPCRRPAAVCSRRCSAQSRGCACVRRGNPSAPGARTPRPTTGAS